MTMEHDVRAWSRNGNIRLEECRDTLEDFYQRIKARLMAEGVHVWTGISDASGRGADLSAMPPKTRPTNEEEAETTALKTLAADVERGFKCGGLTGGLYEDFAIEVARRALRTVKTERLDKLAQNAAVREILLREGRCPDCGRRFNDKGLTCPKCFHNHSVGYWAAKAKHEAERAADMHKNGKLEEVWTAPDGKHHCKAGGAVADILNAISLVVGPCGAGNITDDGRAILQRHRDQWVIDGE